jgi:hypothetical protein
MSSLVLIRHLNAASSLSYVRSCLICISVNLMHNCNPEYVTCVKFGVSSAQISK